MKILKILGSIIIIIVLIIFGSSYYIKSNLNKKVNYNNELIVKIPKNTSITEAVKIINGKGSLKPLWLFKISAKIYAKLNNAHIYSGYYRFPAEITQYQLLEKLFDIKSLYRENVTFPEGISYLKFADILADKIKIDKKEFLRLCRSDSLLSARNIPAHNVEGYFLPNTYTFFMKIPAKEAIDELLDYQEQIWNKKFAEKVKNSKYSKHEIITLASIVDAETAVPEEKPIVSGLYRNRLAKGMLLQADPTVQFAIGKKRRVLYKDLEINNPYNTYVYPGLPPGPINCPGLASIDAAVNPQEHDYYYMVAVGDGSGKHNFAKTHRQHINYVNEFRRNARR